MSALISGIAFFSCTNPFAPGLADTDQDAPVISDQKTVEGIFENFRYAYIFKDTLVYGNLLADDFTFIYRNYNDNVDYSWGRDQDMMTTSGLFRAAQNLELIWNDVVIAIGDTVLKDISRGFNLSIVFGPSDIVNIQGRANFRLKRQNTDEPWKIFQWRDESNY